MAQAAAVFPSTRTRRVASPERWQRAAQRAVDEGVEVRQINSSGAWVANSGTHANVAYMLEIAQGIVRSCSCPAGAYGDPVCKHAAAYYVSVGLIELDDPEPDPPASGAIICFACHGRGQRRDRTGSALPCHVCGGIGSADLVAQAAALVAAARVETCDHCGQLLDDDAVTDDALQRICGACVDASLAEALAARQDAIRTPLAA
jgi:hypothetical protein